MSEEENEGPGAAAGLRVNPSRRAMRYGTMVNVAVPPVSPSPLTRRIGHVAERHRAGAGPRLVAKDAEPLVRR